MVGSLRTTFFWGDDLEGEIRLGNSPHSDHGETWTAGGLRVQVLSEARTAMAVAFLGHGISVVVTGWTLCRVHLPSLRV